MGIVYRIDREIGITYVVWDGKVSDEEFLDHTRRMLADPDWPPAGMKHFIDVTSLASFDLVSIKAVQESAAMWDALGERVREMQIVMVADKMFLRALVFNTLVPSNSLRIMLMHTIPTASVWLGVDPGETERALQALRVEARAVKA